MAVTIGCSLRIVPILTITPLSLAINEVIVRESESRSLEVTLLTIRIHMVLCCGTIARTIVEELGRTTPLTLLLLLAGGALRLATTDLELGLLV